VKPKKAAPKLRPDIAETAYRTMMEATGQWPKTKPGEKKNPEAVARGSKGGKARRDTMTPKELTESARKAAKARWPTKKDKP
jgi:hypothetical protein